MVARGAVLIYQLLQLSHYSLCPRDLAQLVGSKMPYVDDKTIIIIIITIVIVMINDTHHVILPRDYIFYILYMYLYNILISNVIVFFFGHGAVVL